MKVCRLSETKELRIFRGDITKVDCKAVVNPANSYLVMGGGVAGALKRYGGAVIEEEAVKYAPVLVGEAIITGGGRLRARYVIHAPTMERPAMRTSPEKVRRAVKAAMKVACEKGIDCVAFPGMGTGVGGVSPKDAAEVMVEEIINFLTSRGCSVKVVMLIDLNEELVKAYEKAAINRGCTLT
ncbi:MAG: macro domain-containing protein [Thermoprotei archaeon]|nr:MAG: macro domain-containing protein [Thermoprotei archaeon]